MRRASEKPDELWRIVNCNFRVRDYNNVRAVRWWESLPWRLAKSFWVLCRRLSREQTTCFKTESRRQVSHPCFRDVNDCPVGGGPKVAFRSTLYSHLLRCSFHPRFLRSSDHYHGTISCTYAVAGSTRSHIISVPRPLPLKWRCLRMPLCEEA